MVGAGTNRLWISICLQGVHSWVYIHMHCMACQNLYRAMASVSVPGVILGPWHSCLATGSCSMKVPDGYS